MIERMKAIQSTNLPAEQQVALWMLAYPDWATNATKYGVSQEAYINLKVNAELLTKNSSKKPQTVVWAYINSQKISSKEKDKLHLAYGYSQNSLKNAPWH